MVRKMCQVTAAACLHALTTAVRRALCISDVGDVGDVLTWVTCVVLTWVTCVVLTWVTCVVLTVRRCRVKAAQQRRSQGHTIIRDGGDVASCDGGGVTSAAASAGADVGNAGVSRAVAAGNPADVGGAGACVLDATDGAAACCDGGGVTSSAASAGAFKFDDAGVSRAVLVQVLLLISSPTRVSPSPSLVTMSSLGSMSTSTSVSAGFSDPSCSSSSSAGACSSNPEEYTLLHYCYTGELEVGGVLHYCYTGELEVGGVLHYCYTGELEVREASVERLLSTAHQLLLGEVVSVCCGFLASQLHPTNCIGIQLFAESQSCSDLQLAAQKYTAEHFSEVCTQQEFLQLRLPELLQLLSSDDLNVSSVQTILQAVVSWLEHDLAGREEHSSTVLGLVRLPLLPPHHLSHSVHLNPLFGADLRCLRLLVEAFQHHLKVPLSPDAPEEALTRTRPRKSTVGLLYLVGGMDASKLPVEGNTHVLPHLRGTPMSSPRSSLGVGVVGGKLYAVGGRDGSSCLRSVECYDPHTNRWTPCARMHQRRGGVGVGVLGGHLYAVGGHDAPASSPTVTRLQCVERYDPATDTWTLLPGGLPVGCDSVSVCQLGEQLVCVGGYTGTSYLTTTHAYQPYTNTWVQLASLPAGRAGACTVVIQQ
ncbi:kelch-like protein 5 [Hyalella azteca]|uniref:Kelch-like protein 5 n=1 Tax=Hyalella azteca TaxID=294128 RepID=A0A8B7NED0_HYAAZ|nr:kelch-like protein 5 [Hyalella azteca]